MVVENEKNVDIYIFIFFLFPVRPDILFLFLFRKAQVEGKLKCGGCQNTFTGGDYYNVLGAIWHPECFVCQECDTSFGDYGYFVRFENLFFSQCWTLFEKKKKKFRVLTWLVKIFNLFFFSSFFFLFSFFFRFLSSRYDLLIHNRKVSKDYYPIVMIIPKHHGLAKNYYG